MTKNRATRTPPSSLPSLEITPGLIMDPTKNVIALTESANRRQDDMREMNDRIQDSEIKRLEERADHTDRMIQLRADHAHELATLESARVNAIRQVDALAVNTAADRATATTQALALDNARNAENLRNALTSTATTIATQTAQTVSQITERLAALEKSSYEGQGKQAYSDPMVSAIVDRIAVLEKASYEGKGKQMFADPLVNSNSERISSLERAGAQVSGKSEGISITWSAMISTVALLVGLIAIGVFVFTRSSPVTSSTTVPQIIYAIPAQVQK